MVGGSQLLYSKSLTSMTDSVITSFYITTPFSFLWVAVIISHKSCLERQNGPGRLDTPQEANVKNKQAIFEY